MNTGDARNTDLSNLRINRETGRERPAMGKYLKLALWIILPLALIAILIFVLRGWAPTTEVSVATVTTFSASQSRFILTATGYVVAQRQAAVASKGTGRLEYLGVEEGDAVKSGQIIARIENNDMRAALESARAGLSQALAESVQANLEFTRSAGLLASGAATKAEFDLAQARFESQSAMVQYARAQVTQADVALENTFIRAPFDGTVLRKYADIGEIVAPFASSASSRAAVVTMADMKSLEVEADVSESNIQKVRLGQPCEITLDANPDRRYAGYVKKIVPTADRAKATVLIKIAFRETDERVLPEMRARVDLLAGDIKAGSTESEITGLPVVPNSAVVSRNGRQVVFVLIEDHVREAAIEKNRVLGNLTEIKNSLVAGQRVVTSPPSTLKDGDKVKIVK